MQYELRLLEEHEAGKREGRLEGRQEATVKYIVSLIENANLSAEKAMQMLKSKLYDFYKMQADKDYADSRRNQVGTGDRSERIRTYNYPQGRLTDHRINYTVYNLDAFLNGDLEDLIENLALADQKEKLENHKI